MLPLEIIGKQPVTSEYINIKDLVDVLPAAVCWVNEKGLIEYYNNKAAELWGCLSFQNGFEGRYCGAVRVFSLNGDYIPHDKTPVADVLEKGIAVKDKELIYERQNGSRIVVNLNISPIFDQKGFLIGAINCFQDITQRKETEVVLENKNEELLKINNDLDNFIYTASHDLRAPISNIEGLVDTLKDMLKEKKVQDEDINAVLRMVDASVSRFNNTVNGLTEISKVQKNVEEDVYGIEVFDIVQDVCFDLNYLISDCGANIHINTSACPIIRFSKKNLKNIIYNLMTNAIKYRALNKRLQIQVLTYSKDEYSILEIRDNGLGIKEEAKEKIFKMFKRLHDHIEGNGIGLYIVKRLVDNAEGKIEVESEVGKGTTLRIFFKNLYAV